MEAGSTVSTAFPQGNIPQSRLESLKRAVSGHLRGIRCEGNPLIRDQTARERVHVRSMEGLGRVVRRGEHGVKVVTFIDTESKEIDRDTGERKIIRRPWTTTVFHISQTEPLKGGAQ